MVSLYECEMFPKAHVFEHLQPRMLWGDVVEPLAMEPNWQIQATRGRPLRNDSQALLLVPREHLMSPHHNQLKP